MRQCIIFVLTCVVFLTSVSFSYSQSLTIPTIRAASAYVEHRDATLFEQQSDVVRPIASLTKLMTVYVFRQYVHDLSEQVTILRSDVYRANRTFLRTRDIVTIEDLLALTLVTSDNAAANTLARVAFNNTTVFIARMNAVAQQLGLTHTHYADASGLSAQNVSTASEIATLLEHVTDDALLATMMHTKHYRVTTKNRRPRSFTVHSTNVMLNHGATNIIAAKTGYTSAARYCFATILTVDNHTVTIVILRAQSSAIRTRAITRLQAYADRYLNEP